MLYEKVLFHIVRHAQSFQNINNTLDYDSPLTDYGREQATKVGMYLKSLCASHPPHVIFHTGLKRTFDTATFIKIHGNFQAPLIELEELRERDMGIYQHMEFAELIHRNPEMKELYDEFGSSCVWFFEGKEGEGVEKLSDMKNRMKQGLLIAQEICSSMPAILVAHAGSIKIMRFILETKPESTLLQYLCSYVPDNCEIYTYHKDFLLLNHL